MEAIDVVMIIVGLGVLYSRWHHVSVASARRRNSLREDAELIMRLPFSVGV